MSNLKHGMAHTRINRIYRGMKNRCYNKNNQAYCLYGAKGITVCDEWLNSFESFYEWSMKNGYNDSLTIDKDNISKKLNINPPIYSPETCQWITIQLQSKYKNKIYNNKTKVVKLNSLTGKKICEYDSVENAGIDNNITLSGIYRCCSGNRKTAGGFKWRYE